MKIYISHSNKLNFRDELYAPLKESSLANEHTFYLPHDGGRDVDTRDVIKDSDLLIAETSLPSTGSGIEMGWADAFDVPVWCIHKVDSTPSSSTKYIAEKDLTYTDTKDLLVVIRENLSKHTLRK